MLEGSERKLTIGGEKAVTPFQEVRSLESLASLVSVSARQECVVDKTVAKPLPHAFASLRRDIFPLSISPNLVFMHSHPNISPDLVYGSLLLVRGGPLCTL